MQANNAATWGKFMITVSLRIRRVLVAGTAAGLVGLAAAACQADRSAAPAAPATSATNAEPVLTAPATSANTIAAAPVGTSARSTNLNPVAPRTPTSTAPARALKFPNTNDDVLFTGYDTKNNMVKIQVMVEDPASQSARLIPDPNTPGIHELPMAPKATITANDPNGFPFETCPPQHCTVDDMIQSVIGHYPNAFWAHIHVNAADQIDYVQQSAY
ncbi:MAG TPA: hypothetical protein VG756_28035 [Pseudonocardiaceae bacterium]|jgi:hypothetical protein|nr:hypothetical protein [Pseudonocardiaceae bacterium]